MIAGLVVIRPFAFLRDLLCRHFFLFFGWSYPHSSTASRSFPLSMTGRHLLENELPQNVPLPFAREIPARIPATAGKQYQPPSVHRRIVGVDRRRDGFARYADFRSGEYASAA